MLEELVSLEDGQEVDRLMEGVQGRRVIIDKPARLSFSRSLDLLLNDDIDQTNINRDIRDGNWLSIHQQLRPLTANYLAMFKVISTTIYT